ncbi:MAG TPA: signal peptidase I [Candidatus Limnocylindria bacterium]
MASPAASPHQATWLTRVASATVWLLAAGGIAIFVASSLYPAIASLTPIRIDGSSMHPTIPFGAMAFVEPIDRPQVGDVVTFTMAGRIVTHRVTHDVSGNGDLWRTQGDNSPADDTTYLTNDRILGRVVSYVPVLGTVLQVAKEPVVIAFLISTALLLVVAFPAAPRAKRATGPR